MKKILILILSVIMLVSMAFSVSAAAYTQDGIVIELTTDKAEYAKGEKITATVTVTNTNDYEATDVSLECVVPEGYQPKDSASLTIPLLKAGATTKLEVVLVPATGLDIIWIVILAAALVIVAAVVCYLVFRGKRKQVTGAVLCLAILTSMVPMDVIAVGANRDDMAAAEDLFDAGSFTPEVGTGLPTSTGWWITAEGNATLTEAGNVQVKDLRYYMTDADKITEDYTVEFKYQLPSGSKADLKMGTGLESTKLQLWLSFTGGNSSTGDRVNINNGSTKDDTTNAIYGGEGAWHTVQVVVSNTNKTYKLYVDGERIAISNGATKEFGFYNDITTLNRITFACTTGDMLIDDFKLYLGAPESDEEDPDLGDEDPEIPTDANFSDDFSVFNPTFSTGIPSSTGWWINGEGKAALTAAGNVQVTDLRYHMTTGITEDYTVEFKYQLPSGSTATLKLGTGNTDSTSQVKLTLTGGNSEVGDRVVFYDGGTTTKTVAFGGEGAWHTVKVVVSQTNKTYRLYIDGTRITYNSGANKVFGFLTSTVTQLTRVTLQCSTGDMLVDDFKLYLGAPESDEEDPDLGDEDPEIPTDANFSDDFSVFNPTFSTGIPSSTGWWINGEGKAALTAAGNVQVTDLRYHMTTGITEDYTVEFKYQLPSGSTATLKLGTGNTDSTSQVKLTLTGGNSEVGDRVVFYDGGTTTKTVAFGGEGAWHTVKVVVSQTNKTYRLYVDGTRIAYNSGANKVFGFLTSTVTQLTRVTLQCSTGDMLVDDFKLYLGAPESDEEDPDLGDEDPEIPTDANFSDDFSVFNPTFSTGIPNSTGWWINGEGKAALTAAGNVQVTDLRYHMTTGITEDYTVEFKYQLPSGSSADVKLGTGNTDSTSQVKLRLTGGNSEVGDRVVFYDGGTTTKTVAFGGEGAWHTVKVVVSQTNKTYRLYIDGTRIAYNSGANKVFGFLTSTVTQLTRVTLQCSTGDMLVDDFKLYLGAPESDEEDPDLGGEDPEIPTDANFSDDFSVFNPTFSTGIPNSTGWWINGEGKAALTAAGNVQVTDLRYHMTTGITEDYTVEFKYQLPSGSTATLKLGTGNTDSTSQVKLTLTGGDSKLGDRVAAYDGAATNTVIFGGEGEWHTAKVVVSQTNKTYRLYIDGKRIGTNYGLKVFGFLTSTVTELTRVTFQCSNGTMLLDDVKLEVGGPEHAEDPEGGNNVIEEKFEAPLIYEQTFDSWTAGTFESGSYPRWTTSLQPGKGTDITVVPYNGGNILRFFAEEDPESYATATYTFAEPITTDFTVEIRFRQPGEKLNPVGGQVSVQPATGGYAAAGPDLRLVHNKDVYSLNGYNMTMGDSEEDGWHVLAFYANMEARTYDVYANGMLLEEGIPFRNTETSTFNKIIIGHTLAIEGVTEYDYIRIYEGQHIVYDGATNKEVVDGFEQFDPQVVGDREAIPSNYSDVNLSTRNVRSDGYKGHEGSLDILKQFMVTQDKWIYATNPSIVERLTEMGIGIQLTVSPNSVSVQGVDTDAKFYDGTEFAFAWLPAETNSSACLNNPAAFQELLENLKMAVEAGARSIQTDDAMFNYQYYKTGGCFCQYCMTKFADYLLTVYTADELAKKAPGVAIDKNFNYRTYLEKTFGWTTTAQYTNNRTKSPLEKDYEEFQRKTTVNYHTYANEYIDSLGYGDIAYSANISSLAWGLGSTDKINLYYSLFDGSMPETAVGSLTKENMVTASYLESALGRDMIWGAIPRGNYLTKLRTAAARSYALGVQVLIPWDTYNSTPDRAWCTVDEVGDLYHFVRQYPYLFDDYEAPAVVGVVLNMDAMTYANFPSITNPLFNAGIPFKLLPSMSRDKDLKVGFDAADVEGLEYIWQYSPVKGLPEELQQAVAGSDAKQIQLYPLVAQKDSLRFAWVENGTDTLYASVRSYKGEIGAPTSVHVINDQGETVYNTVVGINRKYLPEVGYDVVLYRPGYDPVVLDATANGAAVTASVSNTVKIGGTDVELVVNVSCTVASCVMFTVPEMTEWSILHIVPENATEGIGEFTVSDGWSGLSVGTGLAVGDAISQNGSDAFTLTTSYLGVNVRTENDKTGSQDMLPFVYKNVNLSKIADYSLEGKVSASSNSGIMVREFPASNARFVALYVENGKLMAAVRTTDNKAAFFREIMDVTEDIYLKIVKNGASFEFYASSDGANWGEMLTSVEFVLEKPLAGVFAFSGDGQSATATITDVKLTELGVNENEELGELSIVADELIYVGIGDKLNVSCNTASGLTLSAEDFESVVYTSSDESVLSINADNKLVGLADGEVVLSATANVGKHTVKAEMTITVKSGGKMIIDENFDQWTPETAAPNWTLSPAASSTSNTYAFSASLPSDTDRSLGIMDYSIYQASYNYVLDELVTQNYSVEFDYFIETDLDKSKIGNLNTFYLSNSSGQYQTCLFYEKGYFKFFDNMLWHNVAEVDVNQWVHIKIDINFDEQTNTFTITDSNGVITTASYAFRNASADTSSLRFTTNTTTQGMTVYYNNLKMYLTGN